MKLFKMMAMLVAVGLIFSACTKASQEGSSTTLSASDATFLIDGNAVSLKAGKSEVVIPDSSAKELTQLTEFVGAGELAGGKGKALAVVLRRETGGSGTFYLVAGVILGADGAKGTEALFLGDRIVVKDIGLKDGVITVHYLDRAENAPMSNPPDQPKSKKYKLAGGKIVELP